MGRLLKLVASALVLSAGGGAALATPSAPARSPTHLIVCPLEPGGTVTPPCCGPPVATPGATPCCGTPEPIDCPIGLTAASSPNPSTAGQKVTIAGRWPGATAGQTVDLWEKVAGSKTFKQVASTTTGSLGEFRFVRSGVETNRRWYVTAGGEQSPTIDQGVKAVVTVSFPLRGHLHGRVTPNHAGELVWLEHQVGSRWRVSRRLRLSRRSTYSAAYSCSSTGRVVFPGDRRNMRSASHELIAGCGAVY
jgi:hypothetical protein